MQEKKKGKGLARLLINETPLFETHAITELIGSRQLTIQGLQDILQFTPEEIRLQTRSGLMRICGEKLTITILTQDSIELKGTIQMLILAQNGAEGNT